jgi:hypothetical protein
MVTAVQSFTNPEIKYPVTVENGIAIDCRCGDHQNRHRACKHMRAMDATIQAEIDRAARFLAVKQEIEDLEYTRRAYRQIFYSAW